MNIEIWCDIQILTEYKTTPAAIAMDLYFCFNKMYFTFLFFSLKLSVQSFVKYYKTKQG